MLYKAGRGVRQDYAEAVKWFRTAAERGIPEACYALGGMYYDGRGVSQDYEESFRWWLKAAEKGMAEAQNDVASLYRGGTGVQQDDEKARMWYLKAAEQDDPLAENSLGEMCMKAPGGPDYAGALRWYRRAAEHGCAMAERNIGQVIFSGHLSHAELNAVLTAAEQPLESVRPLEFDKVIGVLLDILAVHQPPGQL